MTERAVVWTGRKFMGLGAGGYPKYGDEVRDGTLCGFAFNSDTHSVHGIVVCSDGAFVDVPIEDLRIREGRCLTD